MSFPLVGNLSYSLLIKGARGLCEEGFSPGESLRRLDKPE